MHHDMLITGGAGFLRPRGGGVSYKTYGGARRSVLELAPLRGEKHFKPTKQHLGIS